MFKTCNILGLLRRKMMGVDAEHIQHCNGNVIKMPVYSQNIGANNFKKTENFSFINQSKYVDKASRPLIVEEDSVW